MKQIGIILLVLSLLVNFSQAQEQQQFDDAADSIYLKCLYEHKQYVSLNLLQFVVGTANLNYELFISKQFSMKIGAGTIIGYRIFVDDYENCLPGGYYYTVEPRWYTFQSTKNCWMQIGVGASYKYWNYTENKVEEISIDDNTSRLRYTKVPQIHHQGGVSLIGKHPVSGGFTFEYQAGIAAGVRKNTFMLTPNVGFSIGWIF
jgi:hypothetical protein